MKNNVVLGRRYRDIVSGFVGIATSKHEYLNGCVRVSLTPPVDKENKTQEAQAYDVEQLEEVDHGVEAKVEAPEVRTGGDRPLTAPHR